MISIFFNKNTFPTQAPRGQYQFTRLLAACHKMQIFSVLVLPIPLPFQKAPRFSPFFPFLLWT